MRTRFVGSGFTLIELLAVTALTCVSAGMLASTLAWLDMHWLAANTTVRN